MESFFDYFKNDLVLSSEIKEKLERIIQMKTCKKGEILLNANGLKKEHLFVTDGCLRSFYKNEKGKEFTIQFAIKDWWISDYVTMYTNKPSVLSIECLTDATVLIFDKEKMEAIYEDYPLFESFQRNKIQNHIAALQKRILSLLAHTASEKYDFFLKEYAAFEKKIPNYQIASYLGIAPESLSRIRKERVKK